MAEIESGEEQLPKSTVSVSLKAGIPNVVFSSSARHPYSKQIVITGEGAIPHIMHVVVTGQLSEKPPKYASLPIMKPLMVLRDPP